LDTYYSKIGLITFLNVTVVYPFESFKKILFELIGIIIFVIFEPFDYAFTHKINNLYNFWNTWKGCKEQGNNVRGWW
jgi:hypothetical protein